jgi:hypothetical protein
MLLLPFIALANVWGYLWAADGTEAVDKRPVGGSVLDHVVDGLGGPPQATYLAHRTSGGGLRSRPPATRSMRSR